MEYFEIKYAGMLFLEFYEGISWGAYMQFENFVSVKCMMPSLGAEMWKIVYIISNNLLCVAILSIYRKRYILPMPFLNTMLMVGPS